MASKKPMPDQSTHDPEVRPKAARTLWSARDRLRILAGRCVRPGELGALLRREGMYSLHLTRWRRQRVDGELAALTPEAQHQTAELDRLRRENQRLQAKLAQAEVIINVQKKRATLLGITLPAPPTDAQDSSWRWLIWLPRWGLLHVTHSVFPAVPFIVLLSPLPQRFHVVGPPVRSRPMRSPTFALC